jgi:hypothetical protein
MCFRDRAAGDLACMNVKTAAQEGIIPPCLAAPALVSERQGEGQDDIVEGEGEVCATAPRMLVTQ